MRTSAQPSDERAHVVDARLALGDEADQTAEVHARGEQQRARGLAIAASAPGFLVVGLEARRQRPVRDGAYVGLVDAHAERARRDDDLRGALHECGLAL